MSALVDCKLCCGSGRVIYGESVTLDELAQLRAGHALLVRLGEAQSAVDAAYEERTAFTGGRNPMGYSITKHAELDRAVVARCKERDAITDAIEKHAISLVASPAQAVKP